MNKIAIPLSWICLADAGQVGNKAAVCGALLEAGFPVPDGWCLPVDAFQMALEPIQEQIEAVLASGDLSQMEGAERAAQELEPLLNQLTIPGPLSQALVELAGAGPSLAVRSSAVNEDLPGASFAGQYQTSLGVRGQAALEQAVLACWRSYFSASALAERKRQGLDGGAGMGVLIQPVIDAECSGVCYSLDPVKPESGQCVINAAWGLGLGVVDGLAAADTAWVRRWGFDVEEQRVVEKPGQAVLDPSGGVMRVPTAQEQRRAACLPEDWKVSIAQFAVAAENLLGRPQDIEWAVSEGRVWLLQSRPIASLPAEYGHERSFPVQWKQSCNRFKLWYLDFRNGPEGQPMLPLERDEYAEAESMRGDACRFLGADRYQDWQAINGRMYWSMLPAEQSEAEMSIRREAYADLEERMLEQGLSRWDYWGPEIIRATGRLAAFDFATADGAALAGHLERALAVHKRHYMMHPVVTGGPGRGYFEAYERVTGRSGFAAEVEAYQFMLTDGSVMTRMEDALYELGCAARAHPRLAALMADPPTDVGERLAVMPEAREFRNMLEDFMSVYGDRTGNGYGSVTSVRTPILRERPDRVLRYAAPYLDPGRISPAEARRKVHQARDEQVEAICRAAQPEDAAQFRKLLRYVCQKVTNMEDHNHYIDQLSYGQLRQAVLAAADWLVRCQILAEREDIFWLRFAEILSALQGTVPDKLPETIAARKAEHAAWQSLEAPPILGLPSKQLPARPPFQDEVTAADEDGLGQVTGIGSSPGVVEGRARVILDETLFPRLEPGDVLVAVNAGPLWTPFFPALGGLVLDSGSLGQHAAATAREYGIPAVVQARSATRRIPDGARVQVDGKTGVVKVLD